MSTPASRSPAQPTSWSPSSGITVTSDIALTPTAQTLVGGPAATATLTATVTSGGIGEAGKTVSLSVDSGPNTGQILTGTTGPGGVATFTYPDTGGPGTDGISASFVDDLGSTEKSLASVTWTAPPPPTTAITGTVTDAAGHGIANICIYPFDATTGNRTADAAACTDASGSYDLSVASAGSYNVVFYDPTGGYATQWYHGAAYEGRRPRSPLPTARRRPASTRRSRARLRAPRRPRSPGP